MRNKPHKLSFLLITLICLMLIQTASAYVYPGPREKIYDLSEWNLLFHSLSLIAIAFGVASPILKVKHYNKWGNALGGTALIMSSLLGMCFIFLGLVKLPLATVIVSSASSSSGIVVYKEFLYAPQLATLGIFLLIWAFVLIPILAFRRKKKSEN